jgi:hypothetical protein
VSQTAEARRTLPSTTTNMLPAALVLAGVALLAAVQLEALPQLLDVAQPLTAGFAKALVAGYCGAVVLACLLAAVLRPARLALPVAGAAALAGATLLATLTVGTEAGSFAAAVVVMLACWQVGHWLLLALRAHRLAAIWPVAWLAGVPAVGMAILFVGRAGALRWWTIGVPALLLALASLRHLPDWRRSTAVAWRHVTGDRLGAASATICLLLLGLAAVFAAAPELMYDALYGKAWLPDEWARTGEITPLSEHVVLNIAGFSQLIAVPGHLVEAEGIGRYMQWLAAAGTVATVWWACRRSPWAPLAAAAVAITPQLFWQSTTAFDDALLILAALALAVAVMSSFGDEATRAFLPGIALGLLGGACIDMKLHMAMLAIGLLGGWLILRGRSRWPAAAVGVALGGLVSAAPPLILRWIDLGNPVLPAWNNVFKSEFWPERNEQLTFPFGEDPGALGPLQTLWTSIVEPGQLNEAAPIGFAGVLVVAIVVALLVALRPRRGPRELSVLWFGLALAALGWYVQFRYLRYILPAGAVAVVAIALALPAGALSVGRARAALAALALMAALLWPATVAQFWNVPGRDIPWEVAFHKTSDRAYEELSMPERGVLETFDRVAPPGAMALTDAHQRMWLSEGRDLSPTWEVATRLEVSGGLPSDRPEYTRLRRLGIGWIIGAEGSATLTQPFIAATIARHGELVAEDGPWRLYRLVARKPADAAAP